MKKMNKKGFTLIEMLVVIAIIAVLVAIIIPTVSNATTKAKAATDAANLRAVLAEASIDYLNDKPDDAGAVKAEIDANGHVKLSVNDAVGAKVPVCKTDSNLALKIEQAGDDLSVITVTFGKYTIEDFAGVAANGG